MSYVNRISTIFNKIIPHSVKGKAIAGTAAVLVTAGSIFGCSRDDYNGDYARAGMSYSDGTPKNKRTEFVLIENGCGFQTNNHNYAAQKGYLYEYNEQKDKWEKTDTILTTAPQMDVFEKVANMNKEKSDTLVLTKNDLKDVQVKNPKEIWRTVKAISCGFRDVMVFHRDYDDSETQLVFSYDNPEK